MSQYSYNLLTIPYNSSTDFYFLIQLSTVEGRWQKWLKKTFDVLKKYIWGTNESLDQNALMMFLKNISKDMKCLEKSKLVQVLVWNSTSLVDVIRRQTYEYKNTLVLQHLIHMHTSRSQLRIKKSLSLIKILVYNTKILVPWYFWINHHFCSPYTCASIYERCFAHVRTGLSI